MAPTQSRGSHEPSRSPQHNHSEERPLPPEDTRPVIFCDHAHVATISLFLLPVFPGPSRLPQVYGIGRGQCHCPTKSGFATPPEATKLLLLALLTPGNALEQVLKSSRVATPIFQKELTLIFQSETLLWAQLIRT